MLVGNTYAIMLLHDLGQAADCAMNDHDLGQAADCAMNDSLTLTFAP